MLSGIGKPADLKAVGVNPHVDLPVGDGQQDHPGLMLSYFTDTPTLLTAGEDKDLGLLAEQGRGPLTSSISEGGGFFQTDTSMESPDVMFNAGPVMFYEEDESRLSLVWAELDDEPKRRRRFRHAQGCRSIWRR